MFSPETNQIWLDCLIGAAVIGIAVGFFMY
jgi:hypothetical protein